MPLTGGIYRTELATANNRPYRGLTMSDCHYMYLFVKPKLFLKIAN